MTNTIPEVAVASANIFNGVLDTAAEVAKDDRFSPLWGQALGNIAVQIWRHFPQHSKTINIQPIAHVNGPANRELLRDEIVPELSASDISLTYGKLMPNGDSVGFYRYPLVSGDTPLGADIRAASDLAATAQRALRNGEVVYDGLGAIMLGHRNSITASIWLPDEVTILPPLDDSPAPIHQSEGAQVIDITARLRTRRQGIVPPNIDPAG